MWTVWSPASYRGHDVYRLWSTRRCGATLARIEFWQPGVQKLYVSLSTLVLKLTAQQVRIQFLSEWDSPSHAKVPSLEKVYEIILPRDARVRHEQYRTSNPSFHEIRSFHSSQCICDLGTKESVLCSFKSCGICCIVKSCFRSFAFGANYNSGRLVK